MYVYTCECVRKLYFGVLVILTKPKRKRKQHNPLLLKKRTKWLFRNASKRIVHKTVTIMNTCHSSTKLSPGSLYKRWFSMKPSLPVYLTLILYMYGCLRIVWFPELGPWQTVRYGRRLVGLGPYIEDELLGLWRRYEYQFCLVSLLCLWEA